MGLHKHGSTMDGALTPICESCGVSLCWDVEEIQAIADMDFWNQWKCQDCNGGHRMSLEQWRLKHPAVTVKNVKPVIFVARNAGHPGDKRPGFDLLFIDTETQSALDLAVKAAKVKFWSPWLVGFTESTNKPGAVLYKPCQASKPWNDSVEKPHPGNLIPSIATDV